MKTSFIWLGFVTLALAASGCNGNNTTTSSQSAAPSPYAGLYLNSADALALRANGQITSDTCQHVKAAGQVDVQDLDIDASGTGRVYEPAQLDTAANQDVVLTIAANGGVSLAGQSRDPDLSASFSGGALTITENSGGQNVTLLSYLQSTDSEIAQYILAEQACLSQ